MRATADATFPLQVAIYLDQCFQLYLSDCVHATTPDVVDKKWLSFHSMRKEIMLGTFQVQHVPFSLLDQLPSLPSGHDKCHGHHPQGDVYDDDDVLPLQAQRQKKWHTKGRPILNNDIVSSWRVDKGHLGFFVARLQSAPRWRGKSICLNFHMGSSCHNECNFRDSHTQLPLTCRTNLVPG